MVEIVYSVPGGFPAVPVIGKINESGTHNSTVEPGFPKPTAGLLPLNTVWDSVAIQPFCPATVMVKLK